MSKTRREFLAMTSVGLVAAVVPSGALAQEPQQDQTPGAPPAWGTGPQGGPEVTQATLREAEKLVQIDLPEGELAEAAQAGVRTWPLFMSAGVGRERCSLRTRWLRRRSGTLPCRR